MDFYSNDREIRKVAVIGCGRWGSFIAWYLDRLGHAVSLYGRVSSANMKQLAKTRSNAYLTLPETVRLTCDINSVKDAEIVIISVGVQKLKEVSEQLRNIKLTRKMIVLCMKGIEISTGRRPTQIIEGMLDGSNTTAVWLGPGHVQEFCRGVPNCMVIDSRDEDTKDTLISAFTSKLIRFYYGNDLVGNEIGAAAKNVIGIAAGMLDGLGISSLKGALMARGTREIGRLIQAAGGHENSVYGLCHLGDYEATVFSHFSQNRAYGEQFVQGKKYDKLAEGYFTAKALIDMGTSCGVELPICEAVYQILYYDKEPASILEMLFSRNLKNEF